MIPAQELAVIADIVIRELGEWDEGRICGYVDENISVNWYLVATSPKADCIIDIYWQEGVRTGEHATFVTPGKSEDDDILVLRWIDGKIETYSEDLGPKVKKYLLDKLTPWSPIFHLMGNVNGSR